VSSPFPKKKERSSAVSVALIASCRHAKGGLVPSFAVLVGVDADDRILLRFDRVTLGDSEYRRGYLAMESPACALHQRFPVVFEF